MVWDSGAEEEVASKDCEGELKILFGIMEPDGRLLYSQQGEEMGYQRHLG